MVYIINFLWESDSQLIINTGGTVLSTYDYIPSLLKAELTQEQHDIILADRNVISISPILKVQGSGFKEWSDSTPKAWDIINGSNYSDNGYNGTNVKVCVIDTGCAQHATSCVVPSGRFKDCVGTNLYCYDDHGHGTMVTNLISNPGYTAQADGVTMYVAKVLDSSNMGTNDDMTEGINWAISQGVDIINLSVYMLDSNLSPDTYDPNTDPVVIACRAAYTAGIIVVSIAGNGTNNDFVGVPRCTYPGKDYSCICVGSIRNTGNTLLQKSSFSNWGTGLDIMAPGDWLISAGLTNNTWSSGQGTSYACPLVAAQLACIKGKFTDYTRAQLISVLYSTAYYPSGEAGNTSMYGIGITSAPPNVIRPSSLVVTQTNGIETKVNISWTKPAEATHTDVRFSLSSDMSSPVLYSDQAGTSYTIDVGSWGNKYFQARSVRVYTKPDGVSAKNYSIYRVFAPFPINIQPYSSTNSLKIYLAGSWQVKPCKVYIGGVWVTKPVKFWNGSAWVT